MTIFPSYERYQTPQQTSEHLHQYKVTFETNARKQKDGIWYLWNIQKHFVNSDDERYEELEKGVFESFLREVYMVILFGEIDTNITDFKGESIFMADPSQYSEEDRLTGTFYKL